MGDFSHSLDATGPLHYHTVYLLLWCHTMVTAVVWMDHPRRTKLESTFKRGIRGPYHGALRTSYRTSLTIQQPGGNIGSYQNELEQRTGITAYCGTPYAVHSTYRSSSRVVSLHCRSAMHLGPRSTFQRAVLRPAVLPLLD